MSLISALNLLAIIICTAVSIIVFLLNPRRHLNIIFMFMSMSFAFWMLTNIGFLQSQNINEALFWIKLFSFWNITVSLLLHFVLVFTEKNRLRKNPLTYAVIYFPGILFCGLTLWKSFMSGRPVRSAHGWSMVTPDNPVFYLGIAWACLAAVTIVVVLFHCYFSTRDKLKKKQIKYVALGFLFPIVIGVSSIILSMFTGVWSPEPTTFPFVLTSLFIGYGIWRHSLFSLTPSSAADNIISTMTDGLLIVKDDGRIQTVNSAVCLMLGYTEQELLGAKADDLFSDQHADRPLSDKTWFYDMRSSGNISDIQTSFITKTGAFIPISLSASILKDRDGTLLGMVFICRDITERKNAQEALKAAHDELENKVAQRTAQLEQANERLAVTLASIGDGVITTDITGRVVLVNKIAEQLIGWDAHQAEGRTLDDCLYIVNEQTKRRIDSPLSQIVKTRGIVACEDNVLLISKDGGRRSISTIASPIRNTGDEIIGMVLVLHDMTEHKTLETELFKARKLESMGVLAAGIANDFSAMLSEIITHLFTAKIHLKAGDEAYRHITDAEAATFRASRLTKQLLTFSKGGAPVKERTSIKSLVEDSVGFCLSGSTAAYRLDLPADLLSVDIDRGQIDQVISNLVINADQAMRGGRDGGTIVISSQNVVVDETSATVPSHLVNASQLQAGTYVCLCVTDEGTGIPAENLDKIFDPYFTTKENCNGLGLTSAYSIIKKHNGYITVDSEIGRGTTFCVYLPAAADTPEEEESSAGIAENSLMEENESL
jgi:PAS domain S-box-containing protein